MSDLYREYILDHYRNPRNHGTLDPNDATYEDTNPLCGDRIRIDLRLDGDRIVDIKFSGRGCAISQAATSMLTEMVEGKTIDEVKAISKDDLLEEIGIPLSPARIKCALLGLKVLKASAYGFHGWPGDE
ncbi:MAG TPA: SUF system NifU family Fe-S cluster assembly protein [Thermomicrobiales bacterium]|jgi:nitrogen fixation NifU-like protein|nr:SUF system NifU family Fe-S cluster assembly protein [Chloroflexota bacterium]HBY45148.1 SUF system NifU family Fe-S cluster assembly protein [Chloroflexota bacterium]HQZ90911.1 SUF system NifU family Fe-S cluster assembly protein [Thermomicrobiales bacterium]HRA33189.1 SUF system NifU family Fe-S cluster assembly protein [Thermomicrobiales bacterium]